MATDDDWATTRRQIAESPYWVGPSGRRRLWKQKVFNTLLKILSWALRLTGLHAWGQRNALDLQLRRHDVVLPDLPSNFDGYRVLHVSDSHFDVLPALVERVRDLVAGLEIDLLVFTGDTLGDVRLPASYAAELLAEALKGVAARDGRLAILGNHDPVEMVDELKRIGFNVLVNESLEIRRGEDRLRLTGLDDVHYFFTPQACAVLGASVEGCAIVLVHSAELADHAAEAGYSLYLSGHTHGGQIALPGGRPIVTQLTRCRHAAAGLWRHDAMIGHTSTGLGVSPPGVRFNTRGEAALLTLRCAGAERVLATSR